MRGQRTFYSISSAQATKAGVLKIHVCQLMVIIWIICGAYVFRHHMKIECFCLPHTFPNGRVFPKVRKYKREHFLNMESRVLFLHSYGLNTVLRCADNLHLLHKY